MRISDWSSDVCSSDLPRQDYPMLQKFAPQLLGIAGAATCALALSACQDQASSGGGARAYISAVGSSTVYPFATAVGEKFAEATGNQTPKIDSTGTGGGCQKPEARRGGYAWVRAGRK